MTETIYLDSVMKWRNEKEYRPVGRARWKDLESVGDGDNLKNIALLMVEAGVVGYVDVYRGKTPVFLGVPLEDMAKGSIGRSPQPEQLRKKSC
jgi:hypothetical protein